MTLYESGGGGYDTLMRTRSADSALLVFAVLLLAPGIYLGSYAALVVRSSSLTTEYFVGHDRLVFGPQYRAGGQAAEYLFAPAWYVDWQIARRNHWEMSQQLLEPGPGGSGPGPGCLAEDSVYFINN